MKEIEDKIDNLINILDNNEYVKKIKELNTIIKDDKELMKLLEEYKYNKSDSLKRKILENENFKEYKTNETEINFIIMYLNKKLKEIQDGKECI